MTNSLYAGLLMLGRPQFDIALANQFYHSVQEGLKKEGVILNVYDKPITVAQEAAEAISALPVDKLDALVVVQGTFTDATLIMAVAGLVDLPLLIWATKEQPVGERLRLNSFCGLNLGAHALYGSGEKFKGIYGDPASRETMDQVMAFIRAAGAVKWIKGKKIGLFGHRPKGYYPSNFNEIQLLHKFGVTVEYIALETVFKAADEIEIADETEYTGCLKFKEELDRGAISKSVRAYEALKKIIAAQSLDAIAIECWPDFMNTYGGAVCFSVGKLNDDGIVAACEADINGAISMLFAQYLSKQAVFLADLVAGDEEKNELVFWHCGGAPRSLAACQGECYAGVHPNRKLPLALYFPLKEGPVTISRLSPGRGEHLRLLIGKGDSKEAPMLFNGNSLPVKTERPVAGIIDNLLEQGFEHHYVVSYGNITRELKEVVKLLDLEEVEL